MSKCKCIKYLNSDKCLCRLQQFMVNDNFNYESYGNCKINGCYYIPDPNIINDFILNNEYANFFKFIDIRTPFYKFYMDIDLKILKQFKQIKYDIICNFIITNIIKVLQTNIKYTNENYFQYIYATKNTYNSGIHLYFPNIIINNENSIAIVTKIINYLDNTNKFAGFNNKIWSNLIDRAIYSTRRPNGMKMLFQYDDDNTCYEINCEKSTYPNVTTDKLQQLQLTCLKTNHNQLNFKYQN